MKESAACEKRVALTPEGVKKLKPLGFDIHIAKGAGDKACFSDHDYAQAGAHVESDDKKLFKDAKLALRVGEATSEDITNLPPQTILVGVLKPHDNKKELKELASKKITSFSLELVPRITRAQSMDVLSSQSNLAGYRAVIEGANLLGRVFPMMMTAAGTVAPSRVLILGAGVAGLQAIATAKRLGAIVSAFDVRSAAKEQVESLGATFVQVDLEESGDGAGGYAKEMSEAAKKAQKAKLTEVLKTQDLVITTAQIPFKKAPILIDDAMVSGMKSGSVIVDLAAETGGNCTLSKLGKTTNHKGVTIYAPQLIVGNIAQDASALFSRNIISFVQNLIKDEKIQFEDEIVKASCLTHDGHIVHPLFKGDA